MTTDETVLDPAALALVRRALDAKALSESVLEGNGDRPAIGFADLYRYATDPDYQPKPELVRAVSDNLDLRRDFEALLRNTALVRLPQVAAASSGAIQTREAEGCRLAFRESRADSDQLYVIIELTDKAAQPSSLFVCGDGQLVQKISLPTPRDGRVQLLLDAGSDLVAALRNIDSEVFLR